MLDDRALVTLDLGFADPRRFPPDATGWVSALRVHDRPGRRDLDTVVDVLIVALRRARDQPAHADPSR